MRHVAVETIRSTVRDLCIQAATVLPEDVVEALKRTAARAGTEIGKTMVGLCIENAALAARESRPICQDTGFTVFFVELGRDVEITGGTLEEAIQQGTEDGYRDGFLRKSIVGDPLYRRINTGTNTPALIHCERVAGDRLAILCMPKGGGSENMSRSAMLLPAAGEKGVIDFVVNTVIAAGANPCPPIIIGVGLGGTAEKAMFLAKKALTRQPLGAPHPDKSYRLLEQKILDAVNKTGIGAQGFGGTDTALAVHMETFPCHIASLPVAVNLNCHAGRMASCVL